MLNLYASMFQSSNAMLRNRSRNLRMQKILDLSLLQQIKIVQLVPVLQDIPLDLR